MLIQNYLGRGFGDLLKPLTMQQVAPIGYVAAELTAIKLFGFSEWSLRLFAIVTSIAGLFVFRDLAGRVLGKVPMVLAVGVLAVSYYPIRHAAECKPYGSDLTAALVLVWLAVRWLQNPEKRRWLWASPWRAPWRSRFRIRRSSSRAEWHSRWCCRYGVRVISRRGGPSRFTTCWWRSYFWRC